MTINYCSLLQIARWWSPAKKNDTVFSRVELSYAKPSKHKFCYLDKIRWRPPRKLCKVNLNSSTHLSALATNQPKELLK